MKKVLKTAVVTLCLALATQAATVPVQNMTPLSLAAEYMHTLNGHQALYDADSSALAAHFFRLHYAPINWLRFSAGFGGSHSYATPFIKGSKADIGVTAGFGLYIPRVLDFLSLTGGYDGYYLKATEKASETSEYAIPKAWDENGNATEFDMINFLSYEKNGHTTAALHVPYLALVFHAGRYADIEIGGLLQYFDLIKKNKQSTTREPRLDGMLDVTTHSVSVEPNFIQDQVRFFTTLTLHERESGAYLTGGFSYALTNQAMEGKSALNDFSFWAQIGLIMTDKTRGTVTPRRSGRYSSTYADLVTRQERMAGELNRDITLDRQRRAEFMKKCKNHRHDNKGHCIMDTEGNYQPLKDRPEQSAEENEGDIIIISIEE